MVKAIFILLGGLLGPRLGEIALSPLALNINREKDWQLQNNILDLTIEAEMGKISWDAFIGRYNSLLQAGVNPKKGSESIRLPSVVDGNLVILLHELAQQNQLWLLSDYPLPVLTPFLSNFDSFSIFGNRILVIADLGLKDLYPDLFSSILVRVDGHAGQCLLISGQQLATSRAIKFGLPAVQYVSPIRLRRELVMRKIALPKIETEELTRI